MSGSRRDIERRDIERHEIERRVGAVSGSFRRRAAAVVASALVVAGAGACSSSDEFTLDGDFGPAPSLEVSVREFVTARSLADLPSGAARTPVTEHLSPRCADARSSLAPVFEFSVIRDYDAMIDGEGAELSYDIVLLSGINVDETPDTGIAPPGPPIEVRAERWTNVGGRWLWDGC